MGTRADFYIGRGEEAKWIGSVAWDGFPDSVGADLLSATTEEEYLAVFNSTIAKRKDFTDPVQGWPWPWEDSQTTDYSFAFDQNKVWATCFGYFWFDPSDKDAEDREQSHKETKFPNMKAIQNVATDGRSGLLIMRAPTAQKEILAKHERVLQMLEIAVAQLQYTQNLFKAEDLDNSVVLSMIAHEIAQIESLKK